MSTWIEIWMSAGTISVTGFSSPLKTIAHEAFFTPQSTFQRFVTPFISILLCTPGGWLLPSVCDSIFQGIWLMLPFDVQTQFWYGGILRPLPGLSFAAGTLLEKVLAPNMRWDERIWQFTWKFSIPLCAFIVAIAILNLLVVLAADILLAFIIYLPVKLAGEISDFADTSRGIRAVLSFIRSFFYNAALLLGMTAIAAPFVVGVIANEFLEAAREEPSKQYYVSKY
jgi:hypothetical protein